MTIGLGYDTNEKTRIDLNEYTQFFNSYGDGKNKHQWECPACNGKLEVKKGNGTAFSCFDCGDHKAIVKAAYKLEREASGDIHQGQFSAYTPEERKAWGEEQRKTRQHNALLKAQAERKKFEKAVAASDPIVKRDSDYQKKHNFFWQGRGFSKSQIEYLESRGVDRSIALEMKLYSSRSAIEIPVFNIDGMIVGSQVKHLYQKGYVWGTQGQNWLHETGQLPLGFWGNRVNPQRIILVEGLGFKGYFTSKRYPESLVVGASGGNFAISNKDLKTVTDRYPGIEVVLMPDAGCTNDNGVMARYRQLEKLVTSFDRELSIGWWDQTTKEVGDIDEISISTKVRKIDWANFELIVRTTGLANKSLLSAKITGSRVRDLNLAIGNSINAFNDKIDEWYTQDSLAQILIKAIECGYKHSLDRSGTGSGKSRAYGLLPKAIQALIDSKIKDIYYVQNNHRHPSEAKVERNYEDVVSRHNGLYIDPNRRTDDGSQWLQRTQPAGADWAITRGNCHFTAEHVQLRASGWSGDEEKNPVCAICPFNDRCHFESGDGYGYKYQRKGSLNNQSVRIAPASLDSVKKRNYSNTLCIWDDQKMTISREVVAIEKDLNATWVKISMADAELAETLRPLFERLADLAERKTHHAHNHAAIVGGLEFDDIRSALNKAAAILQPDFSKLGYEGQKEPESVLAKFGWTSNAPKPEKLTTGDITSSWLVWLLEGIAGDVSCSASMHGTRLTIKHKDTHHQDISEASAMSLIGDATLSRADAALMLGCKESEIMVISQKSGNFDNLNMKIVCGMGSPTKQRAESMDIRLQELLVAATQLHGSCAMFDHIKDSDSRALWHRDSVGSNAYKQTTSLVAVGMPTPNLGAVADDFYMMTGRRIEVADKDPDFVAYVRRLNAAGHIQMVGRLRAQHRPTESLHVYFVCERQDFPLQEVLSAYPGSTMVAMACEEICEAAATPRVRRAIAISKLVLANPCIKLKQMALELDCSPNTIKQMFKKFGTTFKKGTCLLYKALIANMSFSTNQLSDWSLHLATEIVDEHIANLADLGISEQVRAAEVADRLSLLTGIQTQSLFQAIGAELTDDTIELLKYHLLLQIPSDTILHSSGDTIQDLANGLRYVVTYGDHGALDRLRSEHHDNKSVMQSAARMLTIEERKSLLAMVVQGNAALILILN